MTSIVVPSRLAMGSEDPPAEAAEATETGQAKWCANAITQYKSHARTLVSERSVSSFFGIWQFCSVVWLY